MKPLITKDLLALHDKYEGDLGLLDERWAAKGDREKFTGEQIRLFYKYIYNLGLVKNVHYSEKLKEVAMSEIVEVEKVMDVEVADELKKRLGISSLP